MFSVTRYCQISSQTEARQDTISQLQGGSSDFVMRNIRLCLGRRKQTSCNNTALSNPENQFRLASCNKRRSIGAVLLHSLCLFNFYMQHYYCHPLSIEISEQINGRDPSNIWYRVDLTSW